MGDRKPWGQLQPTQDGHYIQWYEDGSTTVYDSYFNVVSDDPSPNPYRAALVQAGRDSDAQRDVFSGRSADENARRWNITSGQAGQQIDQRATEISNAYKVNMMNARTNADQQRATAQYQKDQSQLARDRLAFDRETQQQNLGLNQARLGYDLVGTAANLRGPSNYFQASNYARGVAAQPGTSTFLGALQNNTKLADFGDQAGAPDAETIGSLTAKLSGQAGAGGAATSGDDSLVGQIHAIAARGAHQLGAGQWESLTPTEQKLYLSGLEAPDSQGKSYDADTFLSQWRRSRIGQGFSSAQAA